MTGALGTCARIYHALEDRMNPPEVDRLEFWQAAVMLQRDQKPSTDALAEQLAQNQARAAEQRARPRTVRDVASRPERVIRAS